MNRIHRFALTAFLAVASPPAWSEDAAIRQFDIVTVERLGRAIYDQDQLAWKATDVLFAQFPAAKLTADKLHGWIVATVDGQDIVRFIHDGTSGPEIYCEVRATPQGLSPCNAPQQTVLSADDLAQYDARKTALANIARPCSNRYNTVVLKDPERDDWLVWALAATNVPGVVIYGGHYRFTISKDGKTVIQRDALSYGCMNSPMTTPDNSRPVMMVFTQLVSNTPVETVVWLNLQHKLPIEILTSDRKRWRIENGRIAQDGELLQ